MSAAYSLMGAGLHGINGVSPAVSLTLIKTYITPVLLHGLDSVIPRETDYKTLEKYYRGLLRQIQHLPQSTAKPAIYLLLGCVPAEAQLHRRILTLFRNLVASDGTKEQEIIKRQLAMKDLDSRSFVVQIRLLLKMYALPSAFQILTNTPAKNKWKSDVKQAVESMWFDRLKDEAKDMTTLQYMNLDACNINQVHPVWDNIESSTFQSYMASIKAKLLVQRYSLTGNRCAGKKARLLCPLCESDCETLLHFLIHCEALSEDREPLITEIYNKVEVNNIPKPIQDETLLQILLDSSYLIKSPDLQQQIEYLSRYLCFRLHNGRSIRLGGTSVYKSASGGAKNILAR